MLLLFVTSFLAIAAAVLALRLVIVCCRRSSAVITDLPQEVTEDGNEANFECITGKTITLGPNLKNIPVAYVSRARAIASTAIARRPAANHSNTPGQEDPAMLTFVVQFNSKLATDLDSEFEVNCKAVPATD